MVSELVSVPGGGLWLQATISVAEEEVQPHGVGDNILGCLL